jgi:hypothetical protein
MPPNEAVTCSPKLAIVIVPSTGDRNQPPATALNSNRDVGIW